ncbi:MAG: YdcF family protein [Clostridia bacterium]|nr:YdcF family protein [Clostridia bacterium]
MKQKRLIILIIYGVIVALTAAAVFFASRTYTLYVENPEHSEKISVEYESGNAHSSVLECVDMRTEKGVTKVRFKALKAGEEKISVSVYAPEGAAVVSRTVYTELTATRAKLLMANAHEFGGYRFLCLGIGVLELFTAGLFLAHFRHRQKHNFFTYRSVLSLALSLYFGIRGAVYAALFVYSVVRASMFTNAHVYELMRLMMSVIVLSSLPFMAVFALFLSISNLSLIRHEGFTPKNLLGIFISICLGIGAVGIIILAVLYASEMFNAQMKVFYSVLSTAVSSVFVYVEILLVSAQFCCLYSAKREPKKNKDFIIILGCKIRKDGTPYPLLQGRIDRAVRFYKEQLEATGKQAAFIPSGGQGADEVIPEAVSIKNYLMEQGIEESLIFPETKSATTRENMRFSAEIAHAQNPEARLVFSTTNYHVFRSGILSRDEGLRAAGIGAKTKWYFWPNAQLREFAGLLVHEFKINLIVVAGIIASAALFVNVSEIIEWLMY